MTHGQIEHADDRQARNGTEERTIDPRRAAARRAAGVAQPRARASTRTPLRKSERPTRPNAAGNWLIWKPRGSA